VVNVLAALDRLLEKARTSGLDEVEVYAKRYVERQFKVSNDRIITGSVVEDYDVGLRGAIGKKVGSTRTNSPALDANSVLKKLYSVIKASPEDPHWAGFPSDPRGENPVNCFDAKTAEMSEEELAGTLIHVMESFRESALRRGAEKASVAEGSLTVRISEVFIANSRGIQRSVKCTSVLAWLTLSVSKGGSFADKTLIYDKRGLDVRELVDKATREGELAVQFLNATPIESGNYDVVLSPLVAGELLSYSLAPAFSALNIIEGRSPLRGKLNEQVLGEEITILDNPGVEMALGSRPFDDEGLATSTKYVVYKGVFEKALQSYYTAKRLGVEPTGNGFRPHAAGTPVPQFTNFVLSPVSGDLEEFMRAVKRGIVVYEVIGHWMSDPVTGSVKATITHGLLIENGAVKKPVKGVVIGGSIYEWLTKNLVGVGRDVEVVGSCASPSLVVSNVRAGGY